MPGIARDDIVRDLEPSQEIALRQFWTRLDAATIPDHEAHNGKSIDFAPSSMLLTSPKIKSFLNTYKRSLMNSHLR